MAEIMMIRQLEANMKRVKIVGRLMKRWQVYIPAIGELTDHHFLFIDAEGDAIEAKVDLRAYSMLTATFEEGKAYMLAKFRVTITNNIYKVLKKNIMIQFTMHTTATPLPENQAPLPRYYFDFTPLEAIATTQDRTIVDVIGCLVSAGPIQNIGADIQSRVRTIEITNERDTTVYVSIWENFVDVLDLDSLVQESATRSIVIAFSSLQLRDDKFRGMGLKTFSASRFYLDRTIPQIAEFEQKIGQRFEPISLTAGHQQGSSTTHAPQLTKLVSLAELLAEDFSANKATNYKCVAEIIELDDPIEWYYNGCSKCKVSMRSIDRGRKCPSCPVNTKEATKWYKIPIIVADNTATAIFTLMGQVAEEIVGFPADVVAEEEDHDSDDLPEKITAILHKRYLFTVTVNAYSLQTSHTNFTVKRIEPVPANTPNFITRQERVYEKDQLASHETGLTPQTKNMKIVPPHQSNPGSSSPRVDTASTRSKRKIDFQDATDFVLVDLLKVHGAIGAKRVRIRAKQSKA